MPALSRYAYLHTRVSILAERLLGPDRLEELVGRPLDQMGDLFLLAGLPELAANTPKDPDALEQALTNVLLAETAVLLRSVKGAARTLLSYWMRRFELINLKRIIRGKLTGNASHQDPRELLNLGAMASLPAEELIHTEDIAELLRRLEATHYAGMAREARKLYEETRDPFDLEAAIDREYYAGLAKRVNAVPKPDRQRLRILTGTLIDQTNLVWLLRYRFAYGLSPPHTYFLLIPAGYRLSSQQLIALVQLESLEQVIAKLPRPLDAQLAHASTTAAVEAILDRQNQHAAQSILKYTLFNLTRALAFLWLREVQMRKIHAVVKGKQLQLDPHLIRTAAGMVLPAGGQPSIPVY